MSTFRRFSISTPHSFRKSTSLSLSLVSCLRISGKWKLPILIAISHKGNNRFREIQRSVTPITTRVLSKELKDLEENKLLIRTVYDSSPVIVDYSVSPYCKSLAPLVEEMILWGKNHCDKIRESSLKKTLTLEA